MGLFWKTYVSFEIHASCHTWVVPKRQHWGSTYEDISAEYKHTYLNRSLLWVSFERYGFLLTFIQHVTPGWFQNASTGAVCTKTYLPNISIHIYICLFYGSLLRDMGFFWHSCIMSHLGGFETPALGQWIPLDRQDHLRFARLGCSVYTVVSAELVLLYIYIHIYTYLTGKIIFVSPDSVVLLHTHSRVSRTCSPIHIYTYIYIRDRQDYLWFACLRSSVYTPFCQQKLFSYIYMYNLAGNIILVSPDSVIQISHTLSCQKRFSYIYI